LFLKRGHQRGIAVATLRLRPLPGGAVEDQGLEHAVGFLGRAGGAARGEGGFELRGGDVFSTHASEHPGCVGLGPPASGEQQGE